MIVISKDKLKLGLQESISVIESVSEQPKDEDRSKTESEFSFYHKRYRNRTDSTYSKTSSV